VVREALELKSRSDDDHEMDLMTTMEGASMFVVEQEAEQVVFVVDSCSVGNNFVVVVAVVVVVVE